MSKYLYGPFISDKIKGTETNKTEEIYSQEELDTRKSYVNGEENCRVWIFQAEEDTKRSG